LKFGGKLGIVRGLGKFYFDPKGEDVEILTPNRLGAFQPTFIFGEMNPIQLTGQTSFYQGKVRDVYTLQDQLLVMIASDRISAFDVILPRPIPFKGQVLNQIAAYMLEQTRSVCPNWLIESPAPQVSIGHKCQPFPIEMVVRGNLTGHAWRTYKSGQRTLCGVDMPEGLKENDFFPTPIITPTTKASVGHDEDISAAEILTRQLATPEQWDQLCQYAMALFEKGKALAAARGLILADTKYEFGLLNGSITLMDEVHTPDSSRYFYADGFADRQEKGEKQKQLSKEFVREWLIENNFMGKEGQSVPDMTDEWINTISNRYIELYEKLIGRPFEPMPLSDSALLEKINESLQRIRGI
jgi:phosphoribosylaminoimidazole-succinocarboxamide synthase